MTATMQTEKTDAGKASTTSEREPDAASPSDPLAELRRRPVNLHVFGGYGPLIVALLVAALMVALLPSVAGEQVVEQPKNMPPAGAAGPGAGTTP